MIVAGVEVSVLLAKEIFGNVVDVLQHRLGGGAGVALQDRLIDALVIRQKFLSEHPIFRGTLIQ